VRFIVAILLQLCHKRAFDRPADQGLPWRSFVPVPAFSENLSTFNALTSL
jgi:hypothetical protein